MRKFIFLIGFCLCFFPCILNNWQKEEQSKLIDTYSEKIRNIKSLPDKKKQAMKYNELLLLSKENLMNYNQLLSFNDLGMMGRIEIPKICVNLPIYHGTSENVLRCGIGHIQGSSLPIGGKSTRSLLSGHCGLPNSQLFTRLDELGKNDLFFIHILDQTLAYKIISIEKILPENTESLKIIKGKDLVSLITCTPYGINTHRLIVTGERIPYKKSIKNKIVKSPQSNREKFQGIIPFVLLFIACLERKYKNE